jgi:hypothetical protein
MAVSLTITKSIKHAAGVRECWGLFTPDSSWLAAGEVVDVDGLVAVDHMEPIIKGGYLFMMDYSTQKMLGYYADNNNASDGPLIAIPDATDVTAAVGSVQAHFFGS